MTLEQPTRMSVTPRMRHALALLNEHGESYHGETAKWGVVTSGPTSLIDGQAWINWRTAYALERAELATVRHSGEETEVWIP